MMRQLRNAQAFQAPSAGEFSAQPGIVTRRMACKVVSMRIRIWTLALLMAAGVALTLWPRASAERAQSAPAATPRLFSDGYWESLDDILKLEEGDVAKLERRLAADPDDFAARLKLMAYHQRADRIGRPEDRRKRIQHALWLIEHHPGSEILHSSVARFTRNALTDADYRRAVALWNAATQARPNDAARQWNAAWFFEGLDQQLYLHYLEATVAADPEQPFAIRRLAYIYARSILEDDRLSASSQRALEASRNVWVLGNAAYTLQSLYNQQLQMGTRNPRAAELAERYFERAQALDPNLERKKILPQIDLQEIARAEEARAQAQLEWQVSAREAVGKIRRLPVDAFPEVPPAVAEVLRARICTVPQPSPKGVARNVIRGEFFAKGESGWAVLCSVNHLTALLAFRNDHDTNPQTIATREDLGFVEVLGNGTAGYSREIRAVGRDFIMDHYRAYGGPEPPPIDHQGIDDAFLEKASITWYYDGGRWLQLQGAD